MIVNHFQKSAISSKGDETAISLSENQKMRLMIFVLFHPTLLQRTYIQLSLLTSTQKLQLYSHHLPMLKLQQNCQKRNISVMMIIQLKLKINQWSAPIEMNSCKLLRPFSRFSPFSGISDLLYANHIGNQIDQLVAQKRNQTTMVGFFMRKET